MSRPLRVLVLEDRPEDADLMIHELRKADFDPAWERVESEPEFLAHLAPELDLILADYHLPQFDALRALGLLKESGLDIPFIVVTGSISEEAAVSVMRQGASDYLLKDRLTRLGPAVVGAIEQERLRDEKRHTEIALNENERLYRALFQNAPIGLGLLDAEGRILALNEALLAAAGYSFEEASQVRDMAELFEDPADAQRFLQAVQQNQSARQDLVRFKRKDGPGYDALLTVTAVVLGGRQCLQLMVEDITERKQAEEALHQRAEEMAALQATVLGITAPHDLLDLLQTITERAVQLLNADGGGLYLCDPGRQEARCLVSYNTPRDYTGTLLKYGQGAAGIVAQTGEPLIIDDYRTWGRRADVFEKERPFSAVLSVPMIWQGQVTGVIHVLRFNEGNPFTQADLALLRLFANHAAIATENTRLLQGLQGERDTAQQYLDIAGVIIVAINADQKVALINKKGCQFLGYTAQEIMGKNWFGTCIPEKDSEQVKEVFNRLMAGEIEPIEYFENAVLTKSGEERLIAWQNAVLRDSAGNIVGTLSSGNDVTDRRLAEKALRDSEAELRALFAAMTDVVIVYDTDGRNIKIAPTNPINLYRPLDGMLGKTVHDILPKEQADYIVAKIGEAIQTGRVVIGEYALQIGGKEIWFACSASRLSENTAVWVAHDITERRRAEEGLRESEEKFRSLAEASLFGIYAYREKFIYVNPAFETLTGYAVAELLDMDFWELVHPEFRDLVRQRGAARLRGEKVPEHYEIKLVRKDGSELWISAAATATRLGGEPTGVGIFSDITERKRAEEALRESNAFNAMLLQTIPFGMDIVDEGGQTLFLSPAMEKAVGKNVLGARCWELYKDDKQQCADCPLKRNIELGVSRILETPGVLGGRVFEISHIGIVFRGKNAVLEIFHDITERKQAEQALHESEERYRTLFNEMPVGVYRNGVDGRIQVANPALAALLGYDSPAELAGRDARDFYVDPEEQVRWRQAIEQEGVLHDAEIQLRRKDGTPIWVRDSGRIVRDESGRLMHIEGTLSDITERKQAEETLRASEEHFRTTFEQAAVGMAHTAPGGRWLRVNQKLCDIIGYNREELLQRSYQDITHPDDLEADLGHARQLLADEIQTYSMEKRYIRKDGSMIWVNLTVSLARAPSGDPLHFISVVEDISARKHAEDALRSSEERFRLLAENANDLIYRFRLTPPRGFEYVSPSAIRILGYTPEEIYANPDMGVKMVVPEDRMLLEAATRTPEAFSGPLVMRWQRKDGTIAWIEQRSQPVYSRDSQLIAVQGIARDITERKLAEDEVRRRAAYLEGLNAVTLASTTAPDLPRLLDASLGQILKAMGLDQGAIFVHGCLVSRGFPDFMLQELKNLLPTHTLEVADQALMAVEDWQQPPPGPLERMAPLFRRIGMVATLAVAITTESEPVGAIAVASADHHPWSSEEVVLLGGIAHQLGNATERLRLLQQTEAQAGQLQHILDTVPEGIVTVNQNSEVVLANPLARVYLDTLAQYGESENLLGLAFRPLSELQIPRSDGLPHEVVVPGPRPRIFEIRSSPAELAPAGGGQTLILHEVTEQREMRTATEHQERLAAIGQLAAGIAHDFNNIIAAIILHSELMLAEPGLSDKGLMRQRTILQQAHRAASLTQQVLDFSRRTVLELRPMDLAPFVKETLKLLQRTLPESIQVSLSIEPGETTIRADPARIQQVFMNLALNARDAMPGGGQLRFELSHMRSEPGRSLPFPGMAAGEWLVARVEDTGTGISPDSLPHIFEPFFTTKPHGQGTGLGLSQAFGIVKQHGGFIDVGSRIGEGTTFTIYLPALTRQEAVATEVQVTGAPQGNGETILVVEDAASIRAAVCEILESLNYHTLQAADGEEALAVFEQHADRIDLVVSDLVMPEMGGQELSRALRRRRPGLKLILMTGYPLGGVTRELLQDQEFSWLQKPLTTLGLAEAVHKTLTGKGT